MTHNLRVQGEQCGKWKCIYACVFIPPARTCLLVGAFNPFTFKVNIDVYVPIVIFLIVSGLFFVGFSFSYVSCLEKFL